MSLPSREPVAIAAAFDGLFKSTLAVLIGFNIVNWTDDQLALVIVMETALFGFVAVVVRALVTPVEPPPDDYHPPA